MKKIGIVCALADEAKDIIKSISPIEESRYLFAKFFSGMVNDNEVTVSCCGVGGIGAEIVTRILINKFKVDYVIILGAGGAISPRVKVGDIVISQDIILYKDKFDGENSEVFDPQLFSCDAALREKARSACLSVMPEEGVVEGRIATVDTFVDSNDFKGDVYRKSNGDCVEMEGWYIAKVCTDYSIPFIVIRIISDEADGFAEACFKRNIDVISVKLKDIAFNILYSDFFS